MEAVELNLKHPQHLKLAKGHPFQLSHEDLKGAQSNTRPHRVRFHLVKKEHKRLMRNIRAGKGHRFQPEDIHILEGDGILSSLKKGVRKAADFVKKHVPKRVVERYMDYGITQLADMSGHPELAQVGRAIGNKILDAGYGANDSKAFQTQARDIIFNDSKDYAIGRLNDYIDTKTTPVQGGNILNDLKRFGRKVKKFIPIRDIIKTSAGVALAGMTENPLLAGVAQPLINRGVDSGLDRANIGIGLRKYRGGSFLPAGY